LSITTTSPGSSVRISTCSTPAFGVAGGGKERLAGHRAVEHHRRAEAAAAQCGDDGCGLPLAERAWANRRWPRSARP
jgi:hypothetical protein